MKTVITGIFLLAVASNVAIAGIPVFDSEVDSQLTQIRSVLANDRTPIAIDILRGEPLLIEFDKQESIENIALGGVGDWKKNWEVAKRGSRIFVRLLAAREKQRTLILTTNLHSYVFLLNPHDISNGLAFVAKLIVGFEAPKPAPSAIFASAKNADIASAAPIIPRQPVFVRKNYAYTMQIVSEGIDIRPRAAWDDGRFTYLIFPNAIAIPAIYRTVPGSGEEALVNWHVEGDTVVLHGISPAWNLRMGKSVIGVFNDRYNAEGIGTPNKTTDVEVREQK